MSKEKLFLSIIAALLGLFVAGGAFYIYQMTQSLGVSPTNNKNDTNRPSPTPASSDFLVLENPTDESVLDTKTITVSGKTSGDATIIVSTESADQVVKSTANGDFTLTHSLEEGVNILKVTAIFENGNEETVTRTVTYESEEF